MDIEISDCAPEHKAGVPGDAAATYDDLMRTVQAYREENNRRISELERGSRGDVLRDEKMARMDAVIDAHQKRLDKLALKNARPELARETAVPNHDEREHKAAFYSYVRTGEAGDLRALELKALSVGSNPDGGYTVPVEIAARDRAAALHHLADPRHLRPARDFWQRLQEAVHDHRPVGRLGRRDRGAAADRHADARRAVVSGDGALRHAGGDRDAAGGLARSTSTSGSPPRWSRRSRIRRAPPSSTATASTSRRAFSPTPRSPTRRGAGATSVISRPARPAPGRPTIPRDVLIDLIYAVKAGYRRNGTFVMNRKTQSARAQVQGRGRQLSLAAAGGGERQRHADELPAGRGRGHAGHRGELLLGGVRRLPPRLSGGRPRRRHACCAIRSPQSPTCCSTPPSASAAACRTSTRSSC